MSNNLWIKKIRLLLEDLQLKVFARSRVLYIFGQFSSDKLSRNTEISVWELSNTKKKDLPPPKDWKN